MAIQYGNGRSVLDDFVITVMDSEDAPARTNQLAKSARSEWF